MTFGVLIFPGAEELDFVGPWEMVTMWQQVAQGPNCVMVAQTRALAFIEAEAGEKAAAKVQFASEYYPSGRRYGDYHRTHASAPRYMKQD